jgi:hypothetical protein
MATWNPEANDLFLKALDIQGPKERRAFLDQACGDDELRGEVGALLAAHEQAGSFLETSASVVVGTAEESPVGEGPGAVIGPYQLLQQIGEGGMGVVFLAEQQQPVRRQVALKVIKPGMDSRQVIARFEAERQALALMDHAAGPQAAAEGGAERDAAAAPRGGPAQSEHAAEQLRDAAGHRRGTQDRAGEAGPARPLGHPPPLRRRQRCKRERPQRQQHRGELRRRRPHPGSEPRDLRQGERQPERGPRPDLRRPRPPPGRQPEHRPWQARGDPALRRYDRGLPG